MRTVNGHRLESGSPVPENRRHFLHHNHDDCPGRSLAVLTDMTASPKYDRFAHGGLVIGLACEDCAFPQKCDVQIREGVACNSPAVELTVTGFRCLSHQARL